MIVYFYEQAGMCLGWHSNFLEIVLYLKENYNAKVVHKKAEPGIEDRLINDYFNHKSRDCELIIYDEEKDILKAISWCESRVDSYEGQSDIWKLFIDRNKKEDTLLIAQYATWFEKDADFSSLYNFNIRTTPFYAFTPWTNHEHYYSLRKFRGCDNLVDQMFFLSTTQREDPFKLREMGLCIGPQGSLNIDQYLDLAIKYKVGLAISSIAELCYRDMEYMAIGLPMLRLEYMTKMTPPMIPNYHYIAVDREKYNLAGSKNNPVWGPHFDVGGSEAHVQAYKDRFLEVKDDIEFLNFIATNAHDYYVNYCSPQNKIKYLTDLLGL
jgi:hypothetical protein